MSEPWPPPCIHGDGTNLCPECQAAYDEDPSAYVEFGDHPAGIENWRREKELMEEYAKANPPAPPDPDLPW